MAAPVPGLSSSSFAMPSYSNMEQPERFNRRAPLSNGLRSPHGAKRNAGPNPRAWRYPGFRFASSGLRVPSRHAISRE